MGSERISSLFSKKPKMSRYEIEMEQKMRRKFEAMQELQKKFATGDYSDEERAH